MFVCFLFATRALLRVRPVAIVAILTPASGIGFAILGFSAIRTLEQQPLSSAETGRHFRNHHGPS